MSLALRLLLKRSGVVAHQQGHIKVVMVTEAFQILVGAGALGDTKKRERESGGEREREVSHFPRSEERRVGKECLRLV